MAGQTASVGIAMKGQRGFRRAAGLGFMAVFALL
jgi:hypothetical protein